MDTRNSISNDFPSFGSQLFRWWFLEVPRNIYLGVIRIIINTYNYFSVNLLLKTLFAPWKRDIISTEQMTIFQKVQVLVMNLISRLLGAVVRLATIIAGLIIISIEFLIGISWIVVFICALFLGIIIIIYGIII